MRGSPVVVAAVPELMERSAELAALESHLQDVRISGTGRFCMLAGEAGVGKTALLRRFSEQHASAQILWGACDPLFTPRPLGPLVDIAAGVGGELARLGGSQARPYEIVSALVNQLRQRSPAIVVLEDVHWADEATLDVLRLLSRRIKSAPALLIASYRDDELDRSHPLRLLLGELPRDESIVRIRLHPLSAAAVAAMAGPAGVDSEDLFRKTAGNPFFVTEILASAGDEQIPSTVRDAVLARAARLSPDARSLLDMVAVAPPQAELWLLEAVSAQKFSAIGQCLSSGMLAQQNGAVTFRHELARLAIEESIAPDGALQLHRQTLAALARPPYGSPDLARLAHHAEAANDARSLLRFGRAAGERASAVGAHREAAAQFSRALRVAESLPPHEHADMLQQLAQAYLHANNAELAIPVQERAIELYRQVGDTLNQADALRRQSRLFLCGGRGAEAEAPIGKAVALLEKLPEGKELALAYSGLVMFHMNHDDGEGTVRSARRALELSERVGDTETLLHTLNSLGSMEMLMGDPGGKAKLLRSLELAEEMGNDENVGRAYINLAGTMVRTRAYEDLMELLSAGIDFCLEHGLDLWRMWLISSQAQALLDQGDWSRAAELATTVLQGDGTQLPRVSALPVRTDHLGAHPLPPGLQLIGGGRAERVRGAEQHRMALPDKRAGQLAAGGCLPGAVDPDHEHHGRPVAVPGHLERPVHVGADLLDQVLPEQGAHLGGAPGAAHPDLGAQFADDLCRRGGAEVGPDQGVLDLLPALVVEPVPGQQAEQHRAEPGLRARQPAAQPGHPAGEWLWRFRGLGRGRLGHDGAGGR